MNASRRDFLKGAGALVVSFRAAPIFGAQVGEGQFGTHASHINADALDSWLAIHTDGSVTAFTGKCDFGQGIYTAQTQLVAEELCVPLECVKLVQCDTAVTPDQGSTSGSQSTPTNFNHENLALAAATAREALLKLAAERLGEPVEGLKAENGAVVGTSGRQVRYGDLIDRKQFNLTLNPAAKRRPQAEWTVLGKPVPSLDRTALMTGQFEFVHHVRVPGMLHGRVVRPPAIGASLISVDEASAKDVPGLVKVVVRKNFVGVVAETQYGAVEAARRLKVGWKPGPKLPPQNSFFDSLKEQPSHDALELDSKEIATSLTSAKQVVRARYTYPFQAHGSLGASCAVADVKKDSATVWSATQSVYPTRNCVRQVLRRLRRPVESRVSRMDAALPSFRSHGIVSCQPEAQRCPVDHSTYSSELQAPCEDRRIGAAESRGSRALPSPAKSTRFEIASSIFKQQDLRSGILRKASRDYRTRSSRIDHDVLQLRHGLCVCRLEARDFDDRLLRSPQRKHLRAIATPGEPSHRAAKAVEWLRANYAKPLRMEELATMARMGVSTLHRQFRSLTTMSPLQFQKQLRLHVARERMLHDGMDAASAAFEVGYESASQFNREYSRFFGEPPMRDIRNLRVAGPMATNVIRISPAALKIGND